MNSPAAPVNSFLFFHGEGCFFGGKFDTLGLK